MACSVEQLLAVEPSSASVDSGLKVQRNNMLIFVTCNCKSGLEITKKNYLSGGNVSKIFTLPLQFQPSRQEHLGFLTLIGVKTGTFPSKNLPQLLPFRHKFCLSRKGSKLSPASAALSDTIEIKILFNI